MHWASTLSRRADFDGAVDEVTQGLGAALGAPPDLIVAFVSPHHAGPWRRLHDRVSTRFPNAWLLGCSAGGVIGGGSEAERGPGLSLTAGVLPNVEIAPFYLAPREVPEPGDGVAPWHARLGVTPEHQPSFLLLTDPFSCDVARLLASLDGAYPGCAKVGGQASGGKNAGKNALFLDSEVYGQGLVGVALYGDVAVDTVVAQGCRPIGEPMRVTRVDGHTVHELDGQPAVDALDGVFQALGGDDRELFRGTPLVGVAMDDDRLRPGDFLIRNVIGLDRHTGTITIGFGVARGGRIQFHVRDAKTSAGDLNHLLGRHRRESPPPSGALLFSCLGRGQGLYGVPDHDSRSFHEHLGPVPLGGFFCNGEIGPVHGRTFLHGYTSSFGLFRPRGWD
jgi:small ligand-binding sensory domain FIST